MGAGGGAANLLQSAARPGVARTARLTSAVSRAAREALPRFIGSARPQLRCCGPLGQGKNDASWRDGRGASGMLCDAVPGRVAWLLAAVLVVGCGAQHGSLTVAVALLPSELPVYRALVADFERESGVRVVLVPQQYADIRRAVAAESAGGRGTLDLLELDVYALAPTAPYVCPIDATELQPELAALFHDAVRAGTIDGLRFLPHRLGWQALVYDHAALAARPAGTGDRARRRLPRHPVQRSAPRRGPRPRALRALARRAGRAREAPRLVLSAPRRGGRRRRAARGLCRDARRGAPAARAPGLSGAQPAVAGGVPRRRVRAPRPRCGPARRCTGSGCEPVGRARAPSLASGGAAAPLPGGVPRAADALRGEAVVHRHADRRLSERRQLPPARRRRALLAR